MTKEATDDAHGFAVRRLEDLEACEADERSIYIYSIFIYQDEQVACDLRWPVDWTGMRPRLAVLALAMARDEG